MGESIPHWNSMGPKEEWYRSMFSFVDKYLQDDGALLLIMPIACTYELKPYIKEFHM
jgi:hypothetical protein